MLRRARQSLPRGELTKSALTRPDCVDCFWGGVRSPSLIAMGKRKAIDGGEAAGPSDDVSANITRAKLLHPLSDDEWAEYVANMEKRKADQNVRNADARAVVMSTIPKGTRFTLNLAIHRYNEYCAGKGVPLPVDHPVQLEYWYDVQKAITPKNRKIKVSVNGIIKESSSVDNMKKSVPAKMSDARIKAGSAKKSIAFMGQDQKHAVEGCAINLLLEKLKEMVGDEWNFEPVYDGLQADVLARHTTFPMGEYVPIQLKSAQIQFGKNTGYNFSESKYEPWMYCIGIGIRGYSNKTPISFDDVLVPGAKVYEMWDLGQCATLKPCPATEYSSLEKTKRCFFMHDAEGFVKPKAFMEQMISNLTTWKHRFTRDQILYEMDVVNKKINSIKIPEVLGLKALAVALPGLRAPWRQNETVDSVWDDIGISNKTAGINGKQLQRRFDLKNHKYDSFALWVIASYADCDYQKVAVIPASIVYGCGNKSFCWNEASRSSMKDVTLFDLRTQSTELRAFLKS